MATENETESKPGTPEWWNDAAIRWTGTAMHHERRAAAILDEMTRGVPRERMAALALSYVDAIRSLNGATRKVRMCRAEARRTAKGVR